MVNWSKFRDYFKISLSSIRTRGMRSWLTMVGIFIGIAAVVALTSFGLGLEEFINAEFEELGMNKVYISSAGSIFGAGGVEALTEEDVELVEDIRGVEQVGWFVMSAGQMEWDDELWFNFVMGVPTDPDQMEATLLADIKPSFGREFKKGEKFKAIIGWDYSNSPAFEEKLYIGDKISINGQNFDIIGSLARIGSQTDDRSIIIPAEAFREITDIDERVDNIIVTAQAGVDPADLSERIEKEMRDDRNLDEGDEDFATQTIQELMDSALSIVNIVIFTLIGIAGISLLVGAIGIMNTMYTAVLERTKEIGVMKAIGAKNNDVLQLFLLESGLLGIAGGLVGILLGVGIASAIGWAVEVFAAIDYLKPYFPWWLFAGSMAFAFIVGVLAGVLPARQAALKDPVDSLRYE